MPEVFESNDEDTCCASICWLKRGIILVLSRYFACVYSIFLCNFDDLAGRRSRERATSRIISLYFPMLHLLNIPLSPSFPLLFILYMS